MEEKKNAYKILVGKLGRKKPLGRLNGRCEDNIKTELKGIGCGAVDCIDLAQDMD
jgi:hypothetical protein